MAKKDFSEIVCVIDRSGSMEAIKTDAIGGFNSFVEEQKKVPGKASLTFTQFDTVYEVVYANKMLNDVPVLDEKTYIPRGMTALLDAIGRTINEVGVRLANMAEKDRPEKVIFAILTDGEENASREFTKDKIFEMITRQKETYSWEFIFLVANQDAIQAGMGLGIDMKDAFNFAATGKGVRSAYAGMSNTVTQYRTT